MLVKPVSGHRTPRRQALLTNPDGRLPEIYLPFHLGLRVAPVDRLAAVDDTLQHGHTDAAGFPVPISLALHLRHGRSELVAKPDQSSPYCWHGTRTEPKIAGQAVRARALRTSPHLRGHRPMDLEELKAFKLLGEIRQCNRAAEAYG